MTPAMGVAGSHARRNSGWSLLSSGAVAVAAFVQAAACGRILGPLELGRFSLMWALAAILAITLSFSLRLVLQTRRSSSTEAQQFWVVRLSTAPLLLLGVVAFSYLLPGSLTLGAALLALGRIADGVRDFAMGLALAKHRYTAAHMPLVVVSLGQTIAFVSALIVGKSLIIALVASLAATVILTFASLLLVTTSADRAVLRSPRSTMPLTLHWMRLLWPLSGTALVGTLTSYIPRFILSRAVAIQAVGEYTATASIAGLPNIVLSSLAQAPLTVNVKKEGFERLNRVLLSTALLATGVASGFFVMCILFGEWILVVAFGPDFAGSSSLLWLLAASVVVGAPSWALDAGLIQLGAYQAQLWVNGLALIVMSLLTYSFVINWGTVGVGYSAVAVGIVLTIAKWGVYKRRIGASRSQLLAEDSLPRRAQ